MLLALGLFVFDLPSLPLEQVDRSSSWTHARNPRIGARDAAQFIGPGEDSLSLGGCLLPQAFGSFAEMRNLRDMADTGESWPLVTGMGEVMGTFVITRIREGKRYFLPDGRALKTDFTIELERVA